MACAVVLSARGGGGESEAMRVENPEGEASGSSVIEAVLPWAPKTVRSLLTDAQIARARALCRDDPSAGVVREAIVEQADSWTNTTADEIRALLPGGEVPRAFNVSARGCPVHGTEIYRHGTYPWKLDRDRPFVVICPIGGEEYPSNDFAAYRRSGMTDASLLTGPYADAGRGWIAPDGEKYWFVGYACHWNWRRHWLPAVTSLAQAYVLTGERAYARTCVAFLDRIAECYPGFDYASQSRYSEMTGGGYHGKILNLIWETSTLGSLAAAYDAVFDALTGPDPVRLPHRDAEAIRANIERNLLDEGIDAVLREQIRGNWGTHQRALAIAATVRQSERSERLIREVVLEDTAEGKHVLGLGVDYALYNLVFADGMPFETSPSYAFLWASTIAQTADTLRPAGIDLYANPKVRRMFDAPLELICLGRFTPNLGDASGIGAGWIGPTVATYRRAFLALREPRYAWAILQLDPSATKREYRRYEDLFEEPSSQSFEAAAAEYEHSPRSRLLDDYGLAILNNAADSTAASLTYGMRAGHGHFDRLGVELFSHDRRISPDLGYPDFMNAFVPGIFSWTKNTVSHNTVVVDEGRQSGNAHGRVRRFVDGERARLLDVAADETYPQASIYRRTLLQIDAGADDAYIIDVFRVAGGQAHDLSIHGPPGSFRMLGAELGDPQAEGTLAGRDVEYGVLYDDPILGAPDYRGGYGGYTGSGFQHLFNIRRAPHGEGGVAEWQAEDDEDVGLRVRVLPHENQELILADAYVSPTRKIPDVLTYLLARRRGQDLRSCFVTIWEPYRGDPLIETAESLEVDEPEQDARDEAGRTVALRIRLTDGREHLVMLAAGDGAVRRVGDELESDGAAVAVERDASATRVLLLAGGTRLKLGDNVSPVAPAIRGTVREVRPETLEIVVDLDDSCELPEPGVSMNVETQGARIGANRPTGRENKHSYSPPRDGMSHTLRNQTTFSQGRSPCSGAPAWPEPGRRAARGAADTAASTSEEPEALAVEFTSPRFAVAPDALPARSAVADCVSTPGEGPANAWVRTWNEDRSCMRRVRSIRTAEGKALLDVGPVDLLCGRFIVRESDADARTVTGTPSPPWNQDVVGMHVVNESMTPVGLVISRDAAQLRLAEGCRLEGAFTDANGDGRVEAYLAAAGPGDRVEIVGEFDTARVGVPEEGSGGREGCP